MVAVVIHQTRFFNHKETEIIRVACLGDSITKGNKFFNYPSELQSRLEEGYRVVNFGVGGSTVLLDTDMPYLYQPAFLWAKNFQPSIAVVMLGTNDARTDNFRSIDNFIADYMKLINEIESIKTKPKIFLVKPPPIFDNNLYLEGDNFSEEIIPRIERIADALNFPVIDVYGQLEIHPEYFTDGVHPNNEGYIIIATEIYNGISLFFETS